MKPIVSPQWLMERKDDKNLVILDASYPKVTGEQSPHEGLQIEGARRFDIDFFSDQESDLPHMLASAEEFQEKARALGLHQDSRIVVYDNFGIYSAPRAWWMFKAMGHDQVSILNGGLPEWLAAKYPTENSSPLEIPKGNFVAEFHQELLKSFHQMKNNIDAANFQVVDARSAGRFEGSTPEPRPELSSGHIPGSINIPFLDVLDGCSFKSKEELREIFGKISAEKPIAFSCGSGLSACILLMAAQQVLDNEMSIYDGSWTEWAGQGGIIERK